MSRQAVLISKHATDITSPDSPSHFKFPPSSQPVRSTRSTGSPVTAWFEKLGEYVIGDKRNSSLTEESLQELNKRNALIEARYNSSSPYYKGLTDFSLDINREKLSGLNPARVSNTTSLISPYYKGLTDYSLVINKGKLSGSSPGRESQGESSISSGSRSSLAVKVHEWGSSLFTSKKYENGSSSSNKRSHDGRASKTTENAAAATKVKAKKKINESESEKKIVTLLGLKSEDSLASQKPLRERDTEPVPMLPLLPPNVPPPESLPYPPPQITPRAQPFPSPPLTPISESAMAVQNPAQQAPSAQKML